MQMFFHPPRRLRSWLAGLALVATCSVVHAQSAAPAASAPTGNPIRIAMIEGLSGPFANTGEAVFRNLVWRWLHG